MVSISPEPGAITNSRSATFHFGGSPSGVCQASRFAPSNRMIASAGGGTAPGLPRTERSAVWADARRAASIRFSCLSAGLVRLPGTHKTRRSPAHRRERSRQVERSWDSIPRCGCRGKEKIQSQDSRRVGSAGELSVKSIRSKIEAMKRTEYAKRSPGVRALVAAAALASFSASVAGQSRVETLERRDGQRVPGKLIGSAESGFSFVPADGSASGPGSRFHRRLRRAPARILRRVLRFSGC